MRPTGQLHLGHYHGVLKNWLKLQHEYECFFFVADWHALTTHYEDSQIIGQNVWQMVIDWLAAGINPKSACLFIQSKVPEHAELHLLLSMVTPLGWLERVPSYKDQQERLKERDLATYGFLGYPLLQAADILIYRATGVPVGEDQVAHVELTREVARRFNHLYGREAGFEAFDNIAGGETAGIPFSALIAERLALPMTYVRKKPKGYGRNARIEGVMTEGQRVLLVEDLTTDGGSKLSFVDAIRETGATCNATAVIFYYGIFEGVEQTLANHGVQLMHLCTWWDVLSVAKEKNAFDPDTLAEVESYLRNPAAWSAARA